MEYYDIYQKRLNRFGSDYQSRIQKRRENDFQLALNKSPFRVEFEYEKETHEAIFERQKQNDTKTLHYLLTKEALDIPSGVILMIPDKNAEPQPWMVYYLENIEASGYNRYIMLKMTHFMWDALFILSALFLLCRQRMSYQNNRKDCLPSSNTPSQHQLLKTLNEMNSDHLGSESCLNLFLNQAFQFSITGDSHAVVRDNTEILYTLCHVSSNGNTLLNHRTVSGH